MFLNDGGVFRIYAHPGYYSPKIIIEEGVHAIEVDNYIHNWHIRKPLVTQIAQSHDLMLVEVSDAHNLENIGLRYTEVDMEELHRRASRVPDKGLEPPMASFSTLLFEKKGAVAHISLNRSQALNAYNIQMRDDFSEALAATEDDPDVRAVLITGQGRAFCAGADLTEFGTAPSQTVARQVRWERDVWGQLVRLPKPVVVAVHGYCIGSGVEMALLCDLRLAGEDTIFALPEVQLGMIPAAGGTQTVPRNTPPGASMDILLTGRRFNAAEALAMGLVTRVVANDELIDAAWAAAEEMAALNPEITAAAKKALTLGSDLSLADGVALETKLAVSML